MTRRPHACHHAALVCASAGIVWILSGLGPSTTVSGQERSEGFRFRSAVDLVNVTVTVSDRSGHFVGGLRQGDFELFEDGERQAVTHFDSERVPVSLGIAVDTSGSMAGEKMSSARRALERFLFDLLDPDDEIFLYRFSDRPDLVETWTTDRTLLSRAVRSLSPRGGTALYDAVAEAVPLAQSGQHQKKALLLISDGNDTNSRTSVRAIKQWCGRARCSSTPSASMAATRPGTAAAAGPGGGGGRVPFPIPFPVPGRRRRRTGRAARPPQPGAGLGGIVIRRDDRVNVVGAARVERRQRRPHGSRPRQRRHRARNRQHRRRIEPAVLPRLHLALGPGTASGTRSRSVCATTPTASGRGAGLIPTP